MGRRRDAERTYNGSGKRLSLYLDVNGSLDGCTPEINFTNKSLSDS